MVEGIRAILMQKGSTVSVGAIKNAILAGCALVTTMKTTLRVPTKEDMEKRRKEKEEINGVKKPRLSGIGELQSTSKILNTTETLAKGTEFIATKDIERATKENKTIGKRKRHREEFLLLEKYFELGLTTENPHSVKSNDVTLKKEDLVI